MAAPSYKTIDLPSLSFEPVVKQNKLYVANLTNPVVIQTPPVALVSSLAEDVPFVYIRPTSEFAQFLKSVEAFVLEQSIRNRVDWFRKDLDADALRHNFKSFFREDDFKVKVTGDIASFNAAREPIGPEELDVGKQARCVLELTRICFGRQEFGAMWRLVQVREVVVPECMIDDALEEATSERSEDDEDAEDAEFL